MRRFGAVGEGGFGCPKPLCGTSETTMNLHIHELHEVWVDYNRICILIRCLDGMVVRQNWQPVTSRHFMQLMHISLLPLCCLVEEVLATCDGTLSGATVISYGKRLGVWEGNYAFQGSKLFWESEVRFWDQALRGLPLMIWGAEKIWEANFFHGILFEPTVHEHRWAQKGFHEKNSLPKFSPPPRSLMVDP